MMIPRAHLCAALSLLLAAVATLLLYQPEAARVPPTAGALPPGTTEPISDLTPTSPRSDPASSRDAESSGMRPAAEAARANPLVPQHAFTTVAAGERLEDVARRVYGSVEAVDHLWRANRDTLSGPDSPVEPGTLLRTP